MPRDAERQQPFRFRLLHEDGTDLGLLTPSEPDWTAGQRIHQTDGAVLEVIRVVVAEEGDDVRGYLIVRKRNSD